MKIVIDARVLMDTRRSGVGEYVFELCQNLISLDKDNEYYLFYNSSKELKNLPEFAGAKQIITKIPNKILNYFLFKFAGWPIIDRLIGFKPDLFLMPHLNFISLGVGYKSILTVHDLSFLQYPEFFRLKQNIWHWSIHAKKLVNKFDKVVAISENTKNDLIEYCGLPAEKITVIYSGVSESYKKIEDKQILESARARLNLPAQFILYLGTIEPRKNIAGLIRSYELMRQERADLADVKLVIAGGRGWKCEEVYALAENSAFKNDIIFTGFIEAKDKVFYYNLASLFAFPSFYEGFGFPPLEAMACGLPVVASSASAIPEVVGEVAILANPEEVSELARALEEGLENKAWRENAMIKGIEQAKKFSWEKTARQYLEMFK